MSYIHIEHAGKSYVEQDQIFRALSDVNLDIERGELICLLGPSGCGKSTLLNAIAGFDLLDEGVVEIDGKKVNAPSTKNVTIFQNYGLLPWRTVIRNVELGLEQKSLKKEERRRIAEHYLQVVKLEAFKNRFPGQLSGGQKQRVAIARALAVEPDIIFMDEPFGALDAITRMKLQDDIVELCRNEKKTIIFVTHDIDEATYLADRVVVMTPNPGKIKAVIPVPLHHDRDRTSGDFLLVRDKIFDVLSMKVETDIEYNI
ncbi:MAG: ABC transporter ATP-binding protein [Lachnospiraceae bacterium]|nr:ABC transporter ATP-binding protein [Lachnospiraceae bacterium]